MLRQLQQLEDSDKGPGWEYFAAVDGRFPGSRLTDLTFQRVDEGEPCGDAIVQLNSDRVVIIREMASLGDVGLFGLFGRSLPDRPEDLADEFLRAANLPRTALLEVAGPGPEFTLQPIAKWVRGSPNDTSYSQPVVLPPGH